MTKLINKLHEIDSNKKPIINLNLLEKTGVNTHTQESYDELMRVYELGRWKWDEGDLPREVNNWIFYKQETCIDAGVSFSCAKKGEFEFCDKDIYLRNNWKIISQQEFYEIQNITPSMLKKINKYFENKK